MKSLTKYIREHISVHKKKYQVGTAITLGVLVIGTCAFVNLRHNAYMVLVNDEVIAIVKEKAEAEAAYETVVAQIKKEKGKDIAVNDTISVKSVHSKAEDLSSAEKVQEILKDVISYDVEACQILVDGQPYAIVENQEIAAEVLSSIAKQYLPDTGDLTLAVNDIESQDNEVLEEQAEETETPESAETATEETPVQTEAVLAAEETPAATLNNSESQVVEVEDALPQEEVTSKVNVDSITVEQDDEEQTETKGQKIQREIQNLDFNEEVTIKNVYVQEEEILTAKEAEDVLLSNTEAKVEYTIEEGDNIWDVAQAHGTTADAVLELNPQIEDETKIQIGEVINIEVPDPILSISVIEQATYKELIPADITYVEFSDLYDGQTKVYRKGNDGLKEITVELTKVNGKEVSRKLISETTIKEAKTKVIAYGTKEKPKTTASGNSTASAGASVSGSGLFIHPLNGRGSVSSGYGSRWGSFHRGIDLAAPAGTPIYAAAAGKVIYSGYNNGGYGYLIIIDHGNGYQTYYAHCSSLYVNVGQSVSQGQNIAGVGSTGDSTGNHLHFEVRSGGTPVNPYSYIY